MPAATRLASILLVALAMHSAAVADTAVINIDASVHGPPVDPMMYGIFLEEINHGVDGGLYAELIRNRGFEDGRPPDGYVLRDGRWVDENGFNSGYEQYGYEVDGSPFWSFVQRGDAKGSMALEKSGGVTEASAYCLRIDVEDADGGSVGVANDGFFGVGVKEDQQYSLSFYARSKGDFGGALTVRLEDSQGNACSDDARFEVAGDQWRQYKATLTASSTKRVARLVILVDGKEAGSLWLDFVSLFPAETWKGRANGLRGDIAQMIADLKPAFVRFPGGCVVDAGTVESSYHWQRTVGPLEQRVEQFGPWHYRRTHGVGLFEYLQFCDDLEAEPLWVGFAGQTCIHREREHVPLDEMDWVVQSYLDIVQYANGSPDSQWGQLRAKAGRAEPFGLQYIEIGNENASQDYEDRYRLIHGVMKEKHPDLTYLADVSYYRMPSSMYNIGDQHYYNSANWFMSQDDMYDDRDRNLPPVYLGEVAVTREEGGPLRGNLLAALAEGVYLMGCERNSDVVKMVSYAPLLAHVDGRSWGWHGMIYHDSLRVCGTVSYYLWKLFGTNRPDYTVQTDVEFTPAEELAIAGQIGVGAWDADAEFKDVRVERNGETLLASDFTAGADAWENERGRWRVENGVHSQTRRGQGLSYVGDDDWRDYTLTLKARKLSGSEGFLIVFGRKGGDKYWWNLGGWGNSRHAIEHNQTPVGRQQRGRIESDRWYDVKIQLEGPRIRCYLDGELIHDVAATSLDRFAASAGFDEAAGELIVRVINTSSNTVATQLNVGGVENVGSQAHATVLRSDSLQDNNSLNEPRKVTPITSTQEIPAANFEHAFPPHSLTLLRIPVR